MFKNYFKAVNFLESLSNLPSADYMKKRHQNGNFFLLRMKELVKELKINLKQFKFVHIAGTSGKGTTTAMVHNILFTAGKKVGSFYSPHPTTSIERIKVDDKYIAPDSFADIINKLKPVLNKLYLNGKYGVPSYFEIFLGIALIYFKQKKCEYVVLETGCGGEFDATNIIPSPKVSAITNIGYDHTQILGKTLTKIARTKAGIIKSNSIFFTTETRPRLVDIFKEICREKGCEFKDIPDLEPACNADRVASAGSYLKSKMDMRTEDINANKLLAGNICTELEIKSEIIKKGIEKTVLPCRFEIIQKNPTVILDGSHNEDKIKFLLKNLKKIKYKNLYLIFTLKNGKNVSGIVKRFSNLKIKKIYVTRHTVAGVSCTDLKYLYNEFLDIAKFKYNRNKSLRVKMEIDPWQALGKALKETKKDDLILITGSFYLAGELRKRWISEEMILSNRLA